MMMEQIGYPEKRVVFNVQRMSVISCSKLLVSALENDLTPPPTDSLFSSRCRLLCLIIFTIRPYTMGPINLDTLCRGKRAPGFTAEFKDLTG